MWPLPLVFVLPRDWETLDFLSVPFIFFSLGSFFFGAGRTGKARRKLLELSRGIVPYPCSPPHAAGPGLGVAFGFLRIPALLQRRRIPAAGGISGCLTAKPKSSLAPGAAAQAGATSGIWLEKPLRVPRERPRPCPAGDPRLSTPGAVPKGQRRPGRAPSARRSRAPAPLPSPQPRGVLLLLSFRVPTSLDQPKSCSRRGRAAAPARAAGRASPADAAHAPGGSSHAKKSSPAVPAGRTRLHAGSFSS